MLPFGVEVEQSLEEEGDGVSSPQGLLCQRVTVMVLTSSGYSVREQRL
jgi:hypothetical protein